MIDLLTSKLDIVFKLLFSQDLEIVMTTLNFPTFKNIQIAAPKRVPLILLSCIIFSLIVLLTSCQTVRRLKAPDALAENSVIRVNVSLQNYNTHTPWKKTSPASHTAIGAVISGQRVLLTASLLANHRYVELEKINTGKKSRAEVLVIDYEANLALLKPDDPDFIKGMPSMDLTTDVMQGDRLTVLQVKANGDIAPADSVITAIELGRYALANQFLVYRLNGSLQYRSGNFTLPVVKNGRLAGLVMRNNADKLTIDVVPAPVIRHFLEDAGNGAYEGFPRAGLKYASTADPQFRRYIGMTQQSGGIYVESLVKEGPAAKADIQAGDVILKIDGFAIDSRGNFKHPVYGKVALPHLIRCEYHAGASIPFTVFRKGRILTIPVTVAHRRPESFLVPPYVIDTPLRYYVLGGLILQELSAPYLRAYGKNWRSAAPVHLLHYYLNQNRISKEGRSKIVILSRVLTTSYTLGYENLSDLVVTRINHTKIGRLEDVPLALKTPVNGFHKIEFEQNPRVIYLDPDEIPLINVQIQKRYRLPALEYLK